jgi:hypothetical protein
MTTKIVKSSIVKLVFSATILFGLFGCNNEFLDKEPLNIISDAVVWNDENLINAYLADLYYRTDFIEIRGNYAEQTSFAMIASMGGEGRSFGAHHPSYWASTRIITSEGVPSPGGNGTSELEFWKYDNIRDCNFFLEKIQTSQLEPSVVAQREAEVRFLRAYNYFEMVIRYGGVPLITKVTDINAPAEEIYPHRASEKAVYDFIINETNELTKILPSTYDAKDKGKPTKWAAFALQSRAALYAASIAKHGTVQLDGLLGFPASDVEHYAQISFNASDSILNDNIHVLYEQNADPVKNYQNLFLDESDNNKEVIMAEVYDYSKNRAHSYTQRSMPHDFNGTWASMNYFYDFLENFEFADGSPGNSISRDRLNYATSNLEWSPEELFGNRDARFKASVFYQESPWQGGKTYFHYRTLREGKYLTAGTSEDGFPYASIARNNQRTGFMVRKRCNENRLLPGPVNDDETDYIIFRLGEIYLNYAEAAYYLGREGVSLIAINRLRQRAAMPPKTGITEAIIQNERLVELTWENHSYWDIKRWRIADRLLVDKKIGLRFTYNYDTKKYRIEVGSPGDVTMLFQERNYYLPLSVGRTSENPNIVENPDY